MCDSSDMLQYETDQAQRCSTFRIGCASLAPLVTSVPSASYWVHQAHCNFFQAVTVEGEWGRQHSTSSFS